MITSSLSNPPTTTTIRYMSYVVIITKSSCYNYKISFSKLPFVFSTKAYVGSMNFEIASIGQISEIILIFNT